MVFSAKRRIIAGLIMTLAFVSIGSLTVFAAPIIDNQAPTPGSGTTNSGGSFDPVSGVGKGAFDGKYSWYKVYIPDGQSSTLTIDQICAPGGGDPVGNPDVKYILRSLRKTERLDYGDPPDPAYRVNIAKNGNGCNSTVTFSIGSTDGVQSSIEGHQKYRTFALIAEIQNPSGNHERYFTARASGSGARVGVSSPSGLQEVIGNGIQYTTVYKMSGKWNYSVIFAPTCEETAGDKDTDIRIYDPDNGLYNSMSAKLERSPRDQTNPSWSPAPGKNSWSPTEVQNGSWGASGTTSILEFKVNRKFIYRFTLLNAESPNTVQFRLKYDQIDGDPSIHKNKGCGGNGTTKWKLNPDTTLRAPAGAYTEEYGNNNNYALWRTKVQQAIVAFKQAKFRHDLTELNDIAVAAGSGTHEWVREYKTVQSGGTESSIYTKGSHSPSVPAEGSVIVEDNSGFLERNNAPKNLWGNRYTYDSNGFKPGTSTNIRWPRADDKYCERLTIKSYNSSVGSVEKNSSSWVCVSLAPSQPPCFKWNVSSNVNVDYTNAGGHLGDAWVGDRYTFNYGFWYTRPNVVEWADQTDPINFAHNMAGYIGATPLGAWSYNSNRGPVSRAAGGLTYSDSMNYQPKAFNCPGGLDNTNTIVSGGTIIVPYYYNIKPSSGISTSVNVEQGDEVSGSGSITIDSSGADIGANPSIPSISGDANASRSTTRSRPTDSQLIARRYTPAGNLIEQRNTGLQQSELNYDLNRTVNANNLSAVTFTPEQTATYEIGTKICYSMAVNNPTHRDTGWSESQPNCIKIIKSPKVRFENSDVLTGRQIPDSDDGSCDPLNTNAQIRAVGTTAYTINNYGFAPVNQTGSWGEYGVFATGQISGLGSAAFAYGQGSSNEVRKLQFGNQTPTSGGFRSYGSDCTFNWFSKLTKDAVNVADDDITVESQAGKTSQYSKNRSWNISANSLLNDTTSPTILYAKATGQNSCSAKDGSGRIEVTSDITYKASYPNVKDVPRVILMADCGIIIHKNVRNLDVGLITRGTINTCDMKDSNGAPISLYTDKNYGLTKDDCRQDLKVTGPVVTKKINLLRTAGSDTTQLPQFLIIPAENFAQNPSYLISTYEQARQKINLTVEYQDELPPRY